MMERQKMIVRLLAASGVWALAALQGCADTPIPLDDVPSAADGSGAYYADADGDIGAAEHELSAEVQTGDEQRVEAEEDLFDLERLEPRDTQDGVAASAQPLVFGTEPTVVADTTGSAHRTTVQLHISWPQLTSRRMCSGVLVAPDAVLTAAHCVYNNSRGGWAASVEATPARNESDRPYGRSYGKRLFVPAKYRQLDPDARKLTYDYAIVRLKTSFALTPRTLYSKAAPRGVPFALRGYPGVDASHMYLGRGEVLRVFSDGVFWHRAGTYSGMSGSGIVDGAGVFGVHVGGTADSQWNNGVLFGVETVTEVKSWATRAL